MAPASGSAGGGSVGAAESNSTGARSGMSGALISIPSGIMPAGIPPLGSGATVRFAKRRPPLETVSLERTASALRRDASSHGTTDSTRTDHSSPRCSVRPAMRIPSPSIQELLVDSHIWGKTTTSMLPVRSSTVTIAMEAPFLVTIWRMLNTMAPSVAVSSRYDSSLKSPTKVPTYGCIAGASAFIG